MLISSGTVCQRLEFDIFHRMLQSVPKNISAPYINKPRHSHCNLNGYVPMILVLVEDYQQPMCATVKANEAAALVLLKSFST